MLTSSLYIILFNKNIIKTVNIGNLKKKKIFRTERPFQQLKTVPVPLLILTLESIGSRVQMRA
jgi:hypothetical protein